MDLENVKTFVKNLNKKVNEAIGQTMFTPTGISNPMPLPGKPRIEVEAEKETERITTQLLESGTYTQKLIYKEGFSPQDLLLNYIEVDITRQMVWVYINGECVFSTPCVTGRPPKHSTPTGVFYLTYKTTDTYLKGYNDNGSRYSSHVNYWMPFNGGIGFHDALWQSTFGGNWYINHGSHGCVNLPLEVARTIYRYINYSMQIIVYCS